jgi:hypothetical protein
MSLELYKNDSIYDMNHMEFVLYLAFLFVANARVVFCGSEWERRSIGKESFLASSSS